MKGLVLPRTESPEPKLRGRSHRQGCVGILSSCSFGYVRRFVEVVGLRKHALLG